MIQVTIPPTLRRLCGGADAVAVRAGTVGEALLQLKVRFNGVHERVCDDAGRIRGSVLVFVNDEDVRFLADQATPLKAGDHVSIIPAFAGG